MGRKRLVVQARASSRKVDAIRFPQFASVTDFYRIGLAALEIEKQVKKGHRQIDCIVPVSLDNLDLVKSAEIDQDLTSLIEFLWPVDVRFRFLAADTRIPTVDRQADMASVRVVSLFSGGVDSLATLFKISGRGRPLAVFVAHRDQSGTINIVRGIYDKILKPRGLPLLSVYAPPVARLGYVQTRGFLYGMAGIAISIRVGAESLVIGECGPTMFQPQFGPFDSTTMTSHPVVISTLRSIGTKISEGGLSIDTPLATATKAEAIAMLARPSWLPMTHSCISQQFRSHDGTCYGCIIRRIGSTLVGIRDVKYRYGIFATGPMGRDNLLALIRFSHDVLFNFDSLPDETKEEFARWRTRGLFERFALDNVAGLRLMVESPEGKAPLAREIDRTFDLRDLEQLCDDRIETIRNLHRASIESMGPVDLLTRRLSKQGPNRPG